MAHEQTRTATFAPPAAAPARPGRRKRVTWIPGQVARSEEEKILLDALTEQGLQSFNDVKTYLADTLYWRDFLRGGWAADIALLRHLYAREAQDIIGKLQGVALLVEEED